MLFRLISILWLLGLISVFSSPIQHSLNPTPPISAQRHLQAQSYSIKIKIPANLSQRLLAIIIQDPCTVPNNRFYCEPISSSSQIPIPIRKVNSLAISMDVILEYSGYFENPITLDLTYLSQNYVLEYVYPSLTFSGTPTVTLNPLNINRSPGSVSSYFYGYIRAQYTANVAIDVQHDDDCVFWLNDVEYIRDEGIGRRTKRGPVVAMVQDQYYYFNATLKNSGGSGYGLWLSWNMTGSVAQITPSFLYYQIRFQGAPVRLEDLNRNYYCEIVNGLKCEVCDQLCTSCSLEGPCKICKRNASLRNGVCYCNPGYSQNTLNLSECISCPSLCRSCYATSSESEILCETCVENANLAEDSRCYCKEGYFTEPDNQLDCIACPPLCTDCLSTVACYSCVSHAELVGNQCICETGYLQDTRYLNQCTECPDLCKTCEGLDEVCYTCEENAHLESDECICNEGFYQDTNDFDECLECPALCNTCYVDASKNIICDTCKENTVLSNGDCECIAGYLISSEYNNVCTPCSDSLCELCSLDDSGVEVCTQCTNHAKIMEGKCECLDKFTEPIHNTGTCVPCIGSLCLECRQENDIETCTECVENAVGNDNSSCECQASYMESSYSLGTCIPCSDKLCDTCITQGGNEVCEQCEMNAELKDGRCVCKGGYIELMSDPGVCSRCNDPLCGTCYEEDMDQKCEVCVENGVMISGECRCEAEFEVGSDGASCVTCNIEFCKLCDKVECVECLPPRILNGKISCICPSDNYSTIDNSCIPIPFTAKVSSSTNSLTISFSKSPSDPLTSSDYSIDYNISNLSSLLSTSISYSSSTYIITFSSPYRLETRSSIVITFKDSVKDTTSQTLSPREYASEISFYSSSSCISVTQVNDCQSCSRSGTSLNTCDRCDSFCRCVSTSWQTCTEIIPSIESATWNNDMLGFNMRFNIQILTNSFINNDCSQYFTSSSSSQLGTNSICTWNQDLQTLAVSIGINSTLTTGSISLRTNSIPSAYNPNNTYNNNDAESITAPRQYPSPTAVLNTPSIISDCNDLKADGSQSFGNRRRLSYEWSVAGDNAESISNINNLLKSESEV